MTTTKNQQLYVTLFVNKCFSPKRKNLIYVEFSKLTKKDQKIVISLLKGRKLKLYSLSYDVLLFLTLFFYLKQTNGKRGRLPKHFNQAVVDLEKK